MACERLLRPSGSHIAQVTIASGFARSRLYANGRDEGAIQILSERPLRGRVRNGSIQRLMPDGCFSCSPSRAFVIRPPAKKAIRNQSQNPPE
jgi:hypothetical protein